MRYFHGYLSVRSGFALSLSLSHSSMCAQPLSSVFAQIVCLCVTYYVNGRNLCMRQHKTVERICQMRFSVRTAAMTREAALTIHFADAAVAFVLRVRNGNPARKLYLKLGKFKKAVAL